LFLQDTYAVLPQAGQAQLRIFNGFNCKVAVDVSGVQSGTIEPLNFWQAQSLSVDGEREYKVTVRNDGACYNTFSFEETINVTEKEVICNKSSINT
jgi:solute carrier family 15 oligopeptide transporter 1